MDKCEHFRRPLIDDLRAAFGQRAEGDLPGAGAEKLARIIHELWALYQGWASAQPRASSKNKGFSPCSMFLSPLKGLVPIVAARSARLKPCPDTKPPLRPRFRDVLALFMNNPG